MWPQDNGAKSTEAEDGLPADSVTFKFKFNKIAAHYLRPMPVLTNMSGTAELDLHSFHLKATGGKIKQLTIQKADLLFSHIQLEGKATAKITLGLKGSVEDILRVIDHKPLGYPSRYGIKPGSITGQATAVVVLKFPLLKEVGLKDVTFDVTANINHLSIPKLSRNLAISDGQMRMHVNDSGIDAEGKIILNGVQFTSKWLENFDKSQELPTQYSLNGIIEGAAWNRLNLPFDSYIDGPVKIDLTLYGKGGVLVKGNGQFNLMNSKVSFAPLGWEKARNKAGIVGFDLQFEGPNRLKVKNIILQSDNLVANLEIDLINDRVTRFAVPKLIMKNTDLAMLMKWNDTRKYYQATLDGKFFNAAPLIKILTATNDNNERVDLPDFNLTAKISTMLTENNVRIKDVKISAIYRNQDFTHVTLGGKLGTDKSVAVTITPNGDKRKLYFTSNDAGDALRGLGMFTLGIGGNISLSADMVRHEFGISLGGKARVTKFKVIDSPGFSKLLAEKKFAKAKKELEKGGLSFDDFKMDFRIYNGVMEITNGRAHGSSLGIIVAGAIDQTYNEISLSGTITPAYGLNSFLGHIPLIGTILTGGKGQGIFAATYSISGPLDNPEVKINPLSVLAPGIFRSIFTAIGGGRKKTHRERIMKEEMNKMMGKRMNNNPTGKKKNVPADKGDKADSPSRSKHKTGQAVKSQKGPGK
ncbi:MAG: AsmA-like C-terminal region-containing protein [Alphaproteobacteria bacterium]|nr:AsmA-like C-terminal region-containing protein [Alphaproteobacteria bacterium]